MNERKGMSERKNELKKGREKEKTPKYLTYRKGGKDKCPLSFYITFKYFGIYFLSFLKKRIL